MKIGFLALLVILTTKPLFAQQTKSCKDSLKVIGQCFNIHGRVRVVNGAGTVIWHIGTDRLFEVEHEELVPANFRKAMYGRGDVYGRDVFGDFEVCPFTKSKPGEMQMVCVESASLLAVKDNTH